MGDRANFGFKQGDDTLYLYGHWAGFEMMKTLANALKATERRWTDVVYGTRWTISQIVGSDWSSEYGWGLSINSICDGEHSIPIVDFEAGTVTLYDYNWQHGTLKDAKFVMTIPVFVEKFGG